MTSLSKTWKRSVPYLYIAPVQLMLAGIIFIPILFTLWLSLHSSSYGKLMSFIGFENYIDIFTDRAFYDSLLRNVIFVNIVVYGELALGLGFAVFFTGKIPFKKLMISIVMAPYAVSNVLAVLMWRFILEPDYGMLNVLFRRLSLPQFLWTIDPIHAFIVIVLIAIWLRVPFTFLILYNSILGIPKYIYDAARVDGARRWQVFIHITVPIIMPAILICLMFRYIFAFRTFGEIWVLLGGGPFRSTELLSIYLYKRVFVYYEFGVGAAVAWVMIIATLLMASYYFLIMYKRMFKNEG